MGEPLGESRDPGVTEEMEPDVKGPHDTYEFIPSQQPLPKKRGRPRKTDPQPAKEKKPRKKRGTAGGSVDAYTAQLVEKVAKPRESKKDQEQVVVVEPMPDSVVESSVPQEVVKDATIVGRKTFGRGRQKANSSKKLPPSSEHAHRSLELGLEM